MSLFSPSGCLFRVYFALVTIGGHSVWSGCQSEDSKSASPNTSTLQDSILEACILSHLEALVNSPMTPAKSQLIK